MVTRLAVGCVVAALATDAAAQSMFRGIGYLPNSNDSYARAVSSHDEIVVGFGHIKDVGTVAVRWSEADGLVQVSGLASDNLLSEARSISSDGRFIGGLFFPWDLRPICVGFRWSSEFGIEDVGDLPGSYDLTTVASISADGATIVGTSHSKRWFAEAFMWTPSTGMIGLGNLAGSSEYTQSEANAISADGTVVVGIANFDSYHDIGEAYAWTAADGMRSLGVPAEMASSCANAVSAHGDVIAGFAWSGSSNERYGARWTLDSGWTLLGSLPGSDDTSDAHAVSSDGGMIVGTARSWRNEEAFLWTEAQGMRRLRDVLMRDYGLDLRGWSLSSANGIGGHDRVIVGAGLAPDGHGQGWIARLGTPLDVPMCDADWDRNGYVNGDDFDGFLSAYTSASSLADFDGNGTLQVEDLESFLQAFGEGC